MSFLSGSLIPGVPNIDLVGIVAVVAGSGVLFLVLGVVLDRFSKAGGTHADSIKAIRDWMVILWLGLSAYGVVAFTGITSVLSLLALSGIAGLTVSLALQNTLSNLISGIWLLRDRAIRKGDIIEYSGVKGKVVRLSLRNTWVVTSKGDIAIIGNTSLSGGPLVNHTAGSRFPELQRQKPEPEKDGTSGDRSEVKFSHEVHDPAKVS